jgi:hypothetical protein
MKEHPAITLSFLVFPEFDELELDRCAKCGSLVNLDRHHIVPKDAFKNRRDKRFVNSRVAMLCKRGTGGCHDEVHQIYQAAQLAAGRRRLSSLSYCILFNNFLNNVDSKIGEPRPLNGRPKKMAYWNSPPITRKPACAFAESGVSRH